MRATSLLCLILAAPAFAEPPPRLAVMQLRSTPDVTSLASAVGGVVANELQRLGVFEVSSADQVAALLSLERQRAMMGVAEDGSAVSKMGETLKAQYLVTGEVMRLKGKDGGSLFSVQLVLLDAKAGKRVSSELLNVKSEGEVVSAVGPATVKLCSKVLAGRTGTLYVGSSEAAASVKVDGVLRGTTPMQGRLELPAGPHLVSLEKDGFVAYQKEVRVKPGEHSDEQATMVPSPDFIKGYEKTASTMRVGAYIATGVAVAGLVGAGVFQMRAGQIFGTPDKVGTFAYHQTFLNQGVELEDGVDHRAEALRLKTDVEGAQRLAAVSLAAGAAAAVTATVLYLVGDSPGRYRRYDVLVSGAGIAPVPGGAVGSVALQF